MIIISVHLVSARDGSVTELGRMAIANIGSHPNPRMGNYEGRSFRGRGRAALDRMTVSKSAVVENYPRQALHIWNLVARILKAMGYDK